KGEDTLNMVCRLTDIAQGKVELIGTNARKKDNHTIEKPLTSAGNSVPRRVDMASPEHKAQQETIRISIEKLRSLMIQAEEFIAAKSMFRYFSRELSGITSRYYNFWKLADARMKEVSPGEDTDLADWDNLRKWHRERARELHEHISRLNRLFGQYQYNTSRMIDDMLLSIRKTLLMPFSTVLDLFPKMVRDLSKDNGKEIHITIQGGTTEIDRRILEEIKDPLIHIIRNSIDHGIEKPDERLKLNKPSQGVLEISVSQTQEREIQVEIHDDGAGINPEKVLISAIREGVISEEAGRRLTQTELLQLVFHSGVSTSAMITDISGRGLGLAIVFEKIVRLGGKVSLKSDQGSGTWFTILLPLTLATFRGVLVVLGENYIMIPINSVEKVARISKSQIHKAENNETILYEDHHIPLVRMSDTLGFVSAKAKASSGYNYIIIISSGKKRNAFIVDEIIGEQEGIIKPLGGQLLRVRHVSGATVLGDGRVVPVIDALDLLDSVLQSGTSASKRVPDTPEPGDTKVIRILVAEDSLTSRSLLRNLLEAAGYEVTTAIDGWEGYTFLKQGTYDLLVSDIEMPRMNGFELTSKIRSEPEMASLPVILVTALESAEDKQRGLEAGANAYIAKSSFEGSNLVSTIQRLI
ncbi:MAG: response regulator, partial [Bacteroidetes bacterium]|nr:response regulator [Bacteroidota bacterium]